MTRSAFRIPQPQRLSVAVLAILSAVAPAAFADTAADPTTLDKVVVKGERAEGYSVRRTSAGTRFDLAPREIPQSVSIISHQRIEDQKLDDIIDVLANTTAGDAVDESLSEATRELGGVARMQVARDQGMFLSMLVSAVRPRLAVEVGTFTGASSLAIARALPDGGRLLCCDVSEEWTAIARRHWEAAGVSDRIDLLIAPAIQTLRALPDDTPVDFAFIDADKTGYLAYYEELVPRLSDHGLLVVDNVLWSGRVMDPSVLDDDTVALREFNSRVVADDRVDVVMLSVGDGVSVVRRR